MPRLLHTGQVMIDLVMAVDKLPHSGGDVLAVSYTHLTLPTNREV